MASHNSYRRIARVAKAHGTKGEVVTVSVDGLPLSVRPGMNVAIVPPTLRGDRWHEVLDVQTQPAGQLVALSGVTDQGHALELVGRYLLVDAQLVADVESDDDLMDVIGLEVHDATYGALGTIEDILVGPVQDVWVVEGPFGEVLIPAVEQLVVDFPEDGPIMVDLPRGLVPGTEG